jgi:hypothetical protein
MFSQIRALNADKTDKELRQFVDKQISTGRSPGMQFFNRFMEPFAAEAVSITMLSHALSEAIINACLAIALSHVGKPELFALVEAASVKDKWTTGPQTFLPKYSFPKSGDMYETLTILCKRRNSHVHSKITLRDVDNHLLVEGSFVTGLRFDAEGRRWIKRFLALPYELHQYLINQVGDTSLRFFLEHVLHARTAEGRR